MKFVLFCSSTAKRSVNVRRKNCVPILEKCSLQYLQYLWFQLFPNFKFSPFLSNKLSLHFQETPKTNSDTWTFKSGQLPWILPSEEDLLEYEDMSYDTDSESDFITDEELQ